MSELEKIKLEFDCGTTPLDGWSPLTGYSEPNLSSPLSSSAADINQSVSNQSSPTVTTSNQSTTASTSSSLLNANNDEKTCSSAATVHETPKNGQGLVEQIERNFNNFNNNINNGPFILNRFKLPPRQINNTKPAFSISQLKQTQEQVKELTEKFMENKNAFEELKSDYLQFKVNANESLQQKDEQIKVLQLDHDNQPVSNKSTSDDVLQTLKALQDQLAASQFEQSQFRTNVNKSLEEKDLLIKALQVEIIELRALNNASTSGGQQQQTLPSVSNHKDGDFIAQNKDHYDSATEFEEDDLPTENELRQVTRKRKPSRAVGRDVRKKMKRTNHSAMNRGTGQYRIVSLECTEENCPTKLKSENELFDHLKKGHKLKPHRCFASGCNGTFDNTKQLKDHITSHGDDVEFVCPAVGCSLKTTSKVWAYNHWKGCHLIGKYQCNKCSRVTDTRKKMHTHLYLESASKKFACKHPGCSSTFAYPSALLIHQNKHLGIKTFQCTFKQCHQRFTFKFGLVKHIREQHFGLKTGEKSDERDPQEFVRVLSVSEPAQ